MNAKTCGVARCRSLVILFAQCRNPRARLLVVLSRAVSIRRSSGQMPRTASAFMNWFTGGLIDVLACCFFGPFLNGMKRWRNDHRLAGKKRGEKRRVTSCSAQVVDAAAKKARVEAAAAKRAGEADEREKTKAAEAKKVAAAAERRSKKKGLKKRRAAAAVAQKAALEAAAAAEKAWAVAAAAKREHEAAEKTKAVEAKKVAAAERRSMEEGLEKRRAAAAVAKKAASEAAAAAEKARMEAAAAKREHEAANKTKAAEAKKVAAEEAIAAKQAQLVPAVSYKDWQNDADAIERMHIDYPSWVPAALSTMRRKQQLHTGDRSHRFIRKLDALTPTLTYSGCEEDARELEWPQPMCVDHGVALSRVDENWFDNKLECMRRKQDIVGGRSHENLQNLDEIVARLARGMQIPSSSAPHSNSASSLVLWDAKELPIESLIESILGGKTCALSCLGMQPGLSHPPEEIRARFKVLALRVHPDKVAHPRAEEAFVVVRAAYERLSAA